MDNKPKIAIIGSNILSNIGLKGLLEKIIPFAEICMFPCMEDVGEGRSGYFHYFVTSEVLEAHVRFFTDHCRKTIVLVDGPRPDICSSFHCIDTNVSLSNLLKQFLVMEQMVHGNYARFPAKMAQALKDDAAQNMPVLTKREIQILQDIARGKSSKEIAEERHISLSTVLTHRKNLMAKTKAHSATKLVVYAVHHHYIRPDEIK